MDIITEIVQRKFANKWWVSRRRNDFVEERLQQFPIICKIINFTHVENVCHFRSKQYFIHATLPIKDVQLNKNVPVFQLKTSNPIRVVLWLAKVHGLSFTSGDRKKMRSLDWMLLLLTLCLNFKCEFPKLDAFLLCVRNKQFIKGRQARHLSQAPSS